MFASELNVRPWEIGLLTVTQFNEATASFDRMLEEQRTRDAEHEADRARNKRGR